MPRSLVRGRQIRDYSIEEDDLAINSVSTEKIIDGNVTCAKLAPGLCDRLLRTDSPIGRIKLAADFPSHTDFELPDGLVYDLATFVGRVAIYRNGQLLYNGVTPPINEKDPVEVWPGSDISKVQFDMDLRRGETIQVIVL